MLLYFSDFKKKNLKKVAIYGAGTSGAQLEATLRLSYDYSIEFFIDDNKELWRRSLNDIPIKSINYLKNNVHKIDQVLIAIPSLKKRNYKKILDKLSEYNISVLTIPSLSEIASGKSKINSLKPILIEDILGRDEIPPDPILLSKSINKKSILITGAGGSIGSELARKILEINPSRLVLLEINEPSLYQIQRELKNKFPEKEIFSILGSASSKKLLENAIRNYRIDLIFHAAAYKHVPLVEENPIIGLENNIFSTLNICEVTKNLKVGKVVLISSDKAVRPTNLMGVSKRISELIFQSYSTNIKNSTCFSMVRFGNVLGSSGSVVPLFREQIYKGGPVTITDKDMVRYFMTIEEASYLVIQASALAKGGEILLLDMGEPIFIKTLAEKMINLSGLRVKNKTNPNGDIEIKYTGKRAGEKLYEELLISAESEKTLHPLIYKARENYINSEILLEELKKLRKYLQNFDYDSTFKILKNLVPEWENS
jgi:FlaA1/EpsC-like NDP-sugar epimerase